ncbi:glycosyltransferase family A protein [Kingella negevensis]|nr:glycosyltransferase family A protein [Kingella negevensis]MDK4679241.1 glycosyltransferase family A protein [Kingella negevensis]MDK4683037.1 glycosyltransferase family A protein [Kingella negevensis]MDK4700431.1 glycosyltransferase family A protein [Kingella negevensis]WII93977.1 glycosyltransferase family A protein [Kingella negevensis]
MQPEITFIVPAYNIAPYLAQCLNSILQVPVVKEIIIIDDGSTDQTAQVAETFFRLHSENTLCLHQHNQGVSAARNRGIDLARGRYIQFVDADDILHNQHRYPTWLQFAQQNNINIVKVMIRWLKDKEIIAIQTPYLAFTGEAYAATSYDY